MWVVKDEVMEYLLGGDFRKVIETRQKDEDVSVYKLFELQTKYNSRFGFWNYFKKHLSKVVNGVKYLKDKGLRAKLLRLMVGHGR